MSLFVAFQVSDRDASSFIRLLKWCEKLGPYEFDAVIVCDASTDGQKIMEALKIARRIFQRVTTITNERHVEGWIEGPKSLFLATAKLASEIRRPFLLMEPDSIPCRPFWLRDIADEYEKCGARYMGGIYKCTQPGLPSTLMSGIAVYSPKVIELAPMIQAGANWDVAMTEGVLQSAYHTHKIVHVWNKENAPTFVAEPQDVTRANCFPISWLSSECAIFHQNKDGSLMQLLHRKYFPGDVSREKIVVVFPVCAKDIDQAVFHARWMVNLARGKWPYDAVISADKGTSAPQLSVLRSLLMQCFENLHVHFYPRPPNASYPQAANWAFQMAAHFMATKGKPWLWMEADAVVLKSDWLDKLQAEYERCGKDWMGPVVPHMGHLQGTSVYPPDAASRMPKAMAALSDAFDMASKADIPEGMRHDASRLMCHVWTLIDRKPSPVGGGVPPTEITIEELRSWLPAEAVFLHRIKDNSVVQLFMNGHRV